VTTEQGTPRRTVPPSELVATVNGAPISKADVELRIQELQALTINLGQTWTPLSPQQVEAVLEELVKTELMHQDAVARGLDRSLETQRRWEFVRRGFFAQEWLRWSQDRLEISPLEVQEYYDQNKQGLRERERRQLRQLTVASEEQAKQALAQLLSGSAEFTALAQQISSGPTKAQGGLIQDWVMKANEKAVEFGSEADAKAAGVTSLDPVLEAAAFAIDQVNGLSNYVKGSDNRFHIFQLVQRQAERQRLLSELSDQIRNFLLAQKLQRAVDELSGKVKIDRFPELLHDISQPSQ
jgi:hypothetical protein